MQIGVPPRKVAVETRVAVRATDEAGVAAC
jgi:hypothetical protein